MRKTDIMNDNTLKAKGEWAQYHVVTAKDAPPFCPVRWHEEAEALRVLAGEGALYADGVKYPLKKGDCAVILPFVMHSIAGNESFCFEAIIIDVRAAGEREEKVRSQAHLLNGGGKSSLCRGMDEAFDDIKCALINARPLSATPLLQQMCDLPAEEGCSARQLHAVRQAAAFISEHYRSRITVKDVAAVCGYSEFYTMKLFARCTGSSCVDYLNNVRLTAAAAALCTGGKIADAARDAGFNNISYFNKQFKRLFGKTPGQYRNVKKAQQP